MNFIAWAGDLRNLEHANVIARTANLDEAFNVIPYPALTPTIEDTDILIILDPEGVSANTVQSHLATFLKRPKKTIYITMAKSNSVDFRPDENVSYIQVENFSVIKVVKALDIALHELKEGKLKQL